MSEFGDSYDPGPWRGFDFKSARAAYDLHAGRGYSAKAGMKATDCVPASIDTKSTAPLIVAVDVTGSMKDWPGIIFEKLPLLDGGLTKYVEKPEIGFMAIGDAYSDSYPLQVQPFTSGNGLAKNLKSLVIEGGGGGQTSESYELAALYALHNVKMPNAIRPMLIFIGDEGLYEFADPEQAKTWARVGGLEERLGTKELFEDLKKKFSVYCIRKPYEEIVGDTLSDTDKRINKQWTSYLGSGRVVLLPEPRRVCDVILGLVAYDTDNVDEFTAEITERQKPDQVKTVMRALASVKMKALPDPGKSVLRRDSTTKRSRDL